MLSKTDSIEAYTIAVLRNGGRCLLLQRSLNKRLFPGRWSGLGGRVEADEMDRIRASALREVSEESGIGEAEISHFCLRRTLLASRPRQPLRLLFYFTGQIERTEAPACSEGTLFWKEPAEFAGLDIIETTRPVLNMLLEDMDRDPAGVELPVTGLGVFDPDGSFQQVVWACTPAETGYVPGLHYAMQAPITPADTSALSRKYLDLAYANRSPAQRLDLYLPQGSGPHPLILSIHGGAFMGGDKGDNQVLPMLAGLERGYAVASINYRMSGEALFPALVHDARAAVRWLRAHAVQFGLDPARFVVWGGSAGGWQSLMLGVSGGTPVFGETRLGYPEQSDQVQAAVAWFPPTNFLKMDEHLVASGFNAPDKEDHSAADSPESLLLGSKITAAPELVRAANPATYLHPAIPPMLLQHGSGDVTVPHQQSVEFAEAARRIAGPERVRLELLPGAGHADRRFETPENVRRVLDFIDACFRDR
jgi:acetyl esterase/lipase/8-oxo-dGTP pyrophosphatase MutT (NUDIX family)